MEKQFYWLSSIVHLGPYTEFLSYLVLSSDKIIIVSDFNIHVDAKNDSRHTAFNLLLDSTGFSQHVKEPTHHFNHTLHLAITLDLLTLRKYAEIP